ncbi:hypothetical protein [Planifilum fulgidum]|uniref:hypothetical protein n=1 Tax=Planifilum fulgidum TaxID=201973 RepID=UPI0011609F47|nr:hypothetical protein [Planifilum fulgidum]
MEKISSAAFQDLHQKGPTAPLLFEHGNKARNRRAFRFFCPYLERASFDIASLGAAEPAFSPGLDRDAKMPPQPAANFFGSRSQHIGKFPIAAQGNGRDDCFSGWLQPSFTEWAK